MKKKFMITICALLALVFGISGCAYSNPRLTGQDTTQAIYNNGGFSVQYGDYVYFVNGTVDGFSDTNAKQNIWGEVEKGALYRVYIGSNAGASSEMTTKTVKNYNTKEEDREDIDVIDTSAHAIDRVVPKYIRLFKDAGIFIYGDWIYWATPNNKRNKAGDVQDPLTEFYRTKVDGKSTQLIYSSQAEVKNFNVYCFGGATYLTVWEGDVLGSVKMTNSKVGKRVSIEDAVIEVMFPRKREYNAQTTDNSLSDFVFYTRAITADDYVSHTGNVLEMRRPDLKEFDYGVLFRANREYLPIGVDGNTLFFYETQGSNPKSLKSKDFTRLLQESGVIEGGATAADPDPITVVHDATALESVYAFNDTNQPSAFALVSGSLMLYQHNNNPLVVASGVGSILSVYGDTAYVTQAGEGTASAVCRVNIFGNSALVRVTERLVFTGNNFGANVAAGKVFFIVDLLEQKDFEEELLEGAARSMFLKEANAADKDVAEYFVGRLVEGIDYPEEEE